ncbi:MAG TPA: hypothetical protein VJV78_33975 [Polyangiales bacterium]|nr:hypothetical protein [Polyangiales bacterium]
MPGQLPGRTALSGALLLLAACAAASDPAEPDAAPADVEPVYVVDLSAFEELPDAEDPFSASVPGHLPCAPPAYVVEQDPAGFSTLEVRTDVCNYLTLRQPSRARIERGDRLEILMWHNTLSTQESARAYAALQICGQEAWSVEVPIPSPAQSYTPTWRAPRTFPAGCPILLHIHNHGANAWRFGELVIDRHL